LLDVFSSLRVLSKVKSIKPRYTLSNFIRISNNNIFNKERYWATYEDCDFNPFLNNRL